MCWSSEVVTTCHHPISDSYTRAELQLRDIVALCSERKSRVDPGTELSVPLFSLLRYFLDDNNRFDKLAHAQTKYLGYRKTHKLEPVSSTSRRRARAAYHDEYPRDFGPRIAYTVS